MVMCLRVSSTLASIFCNRMVCWDCRCTGDYFRSNTNTKWTWLVPLTKATHFADVCSQSCLTGRKRSPKALLVASSRAAKQLIGYFCGYTTKRQVVGKYELDQAANSMNLLKESLKKDSASRQLARVTNRMISDLQCRGKSLRHFGCLSGVIPEWLEP